MSAARFTTNARVGAPVIASREADTQRLRAIVANAHCSNTGDGLRGLETAYATQQLAAELLGIEAAQVGVASTGVIGFELPREPLLGGVRTACAALGADAGDFSLSIMTSDRSPKRACLEVELAGGSVRLSAQAKGAGMISPRFATMFCFVQTDAAMSAETLDLLTGVTVKRSFDRISVDGQLSTSDTVFALANGASGVEVAPESADELVLGEAMDARAAPARDRDGGRRRGHAAGGAHRRSRRRGARGARRARGRELAAREDGPARRGSQLRPHPAGRGRGLPARQRLRGGPRDRGPSGGVRRRGGGGRPARDRAARRGPGGGVRAHASGRGRRDRGLLQRSLGGVRDLQREYTS